MKRARRLAEALLGVVLVAIGLSAVPAAAQAVFGAISGTVTDSSGAVLPRATVSGTNVATSVTQKLPTNGAGVYKATNPLSRVYKAAGYLAGIKKAIVSSVT